MDKVYEYFYLIMLLGAILGGFTFVVFSTINKRPNKIWQGIIMGLLAITVISLVGFIVTIPWWEVR